MKSCDAWLNGKHVGKVHIHDDCSRADLRCYLPDGWIYRAVLFLNEKEFGRFGVLLPERGVFSGTLMMEGAFAFDGVLHCEIIKNRPGEHGTDGKWMTLDQCSPWDTSAFSLDPAVFNLLKKKNGVLYRIYNQKRYLLFPMDLIKADPLAALFCVGKMMELQNKQFLCVHIDTAGEIVPWVEDEN